MVHGVRTAPPPLPSSSAVSVFDRSRVGELLQYGAIDAPIRIPQRIPAIKRKARLEIELNCIANLQVYKYLAPTSP